MILEIGGIAISSAFIAGLLMFLAPCTFPLVPAYLGFISGVSSKDLNDPDKSKIARRKIFINGIFFILGFSVIFISFGTMAGLLGAHFAGFQTWIRRLGGLAVILFGLVMLGVFKIGFLQSEHRLRMPKFLGVGKKSSSFVIGSSFAVGWTPCVGPILAGILALATTSSTALEGGVLLSVFSLGLAIPFLIIAGAFSKATEYINRVINYLKVINIIGGIFLILLGLLLLTNNFSLLIQYGFQILSFLNYEETIYQFL